MSGRRSVLEGEIQRQIEAAFGSAPDLLLIRNSVGEAKHVDEETAKVWHVPYGLGTGSPDLVAMLRTPLGFSVWFCLEVKAPEGDVDPEQEKCHRIWRDFGALIYVVRSVKEAREALDHARATVRCAA